MNACYLLTPCLLIEPYIACFYKSASLLSKSSSATLEASGSNAWVILNSSSFALDISILFNGLDSLGAIPSPNSPSSMISPSPCAPSPVVLPSLSFSDWADPVGWPIFSASKKFLPSC